MKILCFSAVAAFACASPVLADLEAPVVTSASVSPTSVDVTSAVGSVTITIGITDNQSGFKFGNLYLYDANNQYVEGIYFDGAQRTGGDALAGTYVFTMSVPRYASPGTWRVDALVDDEAENRRNYGPGNTPFPNPEAMTFMLVNTGDIDTDLPTLASVSVTPESVNVGTAGAVISFTVDCGDSLSGIRYGFIYPRRPDGEFDYNLVTHFSAFQRVSGNEQSGIYQVQLTLPQGSPEGNWTFEIYLRDEVGNYSFSPAGSVVVTWEPVPPPTATKNFLAHAVDALGMPWSTGGGGWVMQSADSNDGVDAAMSLPIDDDEFCTFQTTVTGPGYLYFQWRVDSEAFADHLSVSLDGFPVDEISGYTNWSGSFLSIPEGEHVVVWKYAKDAAGSNGDDRGWVDQVRFERQTDESLPQLQALRISPRSLDLTAGTQDVTFEIEVTDDVSGLLEGRVELFDPAGNPRVSTSFDGTTPIQGDSNAGTYQVTLPVPDDVPSGLWRVEITLTEASSNATRLYGPAGDAFPMKSVEFFHAGNPSAPDVSAPLVMALEVTPGTVDLSSGPTVATVTLQITDVVAGFQYGNLTVNNPNQDWTGGFYFNSSSRISGDAFNGIYQVEVSIPQYGSPGTWTVGAYVGDNNGNGNTYPDNLMFPSDVDETFTVNNTGLVDSQSPIVTSIEITPGQVDTSAATAQLQVTVSIEDDLSGLMDAYAYFFNPAGEFQNDLFTVLDGSNRTSGDDISGTYQFTKILPQGSAAGQWEVRIYLRDKTGHPNYYGHNSTAYPEIGDGYFIVGSIALSLFDAYMATHNLSGNDALPGADPDLDGRNNATETMLGTYPSNAGSNGSGLMTMLRDATHLHLEFTIDPTLTVTVAGDFLELRNGGGGAPLKVTGQIQTGLSGAWNQVAPALVSGSTYRISLPFAGGSKGFARLFFETP